MSTRVIITTYNRPEYCAELVAFLARFPELDIHVYDDGSDVVYPKMGVHVHRMQHHGRENYRVLVQRILHLATIAAWDRLVMLPDDVLPAVADPLAEAEQAWVHIRQQDPAAVLTGMLIDRRGHCQQWDSHYPVRVGSAWHTGWNDLCFYAGQEFRRALPVRLKERRVGAHVGSGTGSLFSRFVRQYGNIWNVGSTLWHHRQGESMMNPMERKVHPL